MRRITTHDPTRQLGLAGMLAEAETANQGRRFARDTAHLPGTLKEGIAYYRGLLARHHAAVLAGDEGEVKRLQKEASDLAIKLNGGQRGYLADDDAPGCVLRRRTAARAGKIPLWGQLGSFILDACDMRVRIEMRGIYGVCGYASFNAHAVDLNRPFLSETGYRSFLGYGPGPIPGLTVDVFVARVIESYVKGELRGRLLAIADQYRSGGSGR